MTDLFFGLRLEIKWLGFVDSQPRTSQPSFLDTSTGWWFQCCCASLMTVTVTVDGAASAAAFAAAAAAAADDDDDDDADADADDHDHHDADDPNASKNTYWCVGAHENLSRLLVNIGSRCFPLW